ncbi:MAG TPA: hypothetical protein VGG48_19580 [Rhizomicrobium sp.]
MTKESQRRAVANQRKRMRDKGYERYEVKGPKSDKLLVRKIVEKLASTDPDAMRFREVAEKTVMPAGPSTKGDILRALQQGPRFPDDFDISREFTTGRDIEL